MDAPRKFQVPDSLTSNHSLRKLSLIYSSINDFAILGCYNDHKFYCWTIYVLYIFKDQLVWYDGFGWGGCIQDWYTTTPSEWRCINPNLRTLHKVCWQWGCNGVCHGVEPSRTMTTTKMKETISLLMSGASKLLICRSHAELHKNCIRLDLLQVVMKVILKQLLPAV